MAEWSHHVGRLVVTTPSGCVISKLAFTFPVDTAELALHELRRALDAYSQAVREARWHSWRPS